MSQYIGARYVPKFMGTYDNTQAYENMAVVDNGMGTSYISKVPVPAGTPLTDTNYWALYGASNGAIINLQNQIGDLSNLTTNDNSNLVGAINELNRPKRHYIVIGDSFSYGSIDPNTLGHGWIDILLGLYPNETITYLTEAQAQQVVGVSGFASTKPFLSMLQSIEGFNPDLDKDGVTDIVVIGGTNDAPYSQGTIETAIDNFCQYCKAHYKNAKIRIGIFGVNIQNNGTVCTAYQKCVEHGANFMGDLWGIVDTKKYLSDGTHMTQAGYNLYCPYVADSIIHGETHYTSVGTGTITPIAAGDTRVYDFTIITTEDAINVDFDLPMIVADNLTTIYTIPWTGDAIMIQNNNMAGAATIYGYNTDHFEPCAVGRYYFSGSNIMVVVEEISPHPVYSTFRIALNNATFSKRIYSSLS